MEKLEKIVSTLSNSFDSGLLLNIIRIGLCLTLFSKFRVHASLAYAPGGAEGFLTLLIYPLLLLNIFGLFTEWASFGLFFNMLFLMIGHRVGTFEHSYISHHNYFSLLIILYLSFSKSPGPLSFDSLIRKVRKQSNQFPLFMIRLQICILYFFAGINKLNWNELSGFHYEQYIMNSYTGSNVQFSSTISTLLSILAVVATLYEIFLPFGLMIKKTRKWALISAFIFHYIIHLALPVNIFSMVMMISLMAFIDPKWLDKSISGNLGNNKSHAEQEQSF